MDADRRSSVLRRLLDMIAACSGVPATSRPAEHVDAFARLDLFADDLLLDEHPVDSLALTEVLVRAEEDLGASLFDDDRADDARTLTDLVDILMDQVDDATLAAWLATAPEATDPWAAT